MELAAESFAVSFPRAYLSYNSAEPQQREAQLGPFVGTGAVGREGQIHRHEGERCEPLGDAGAGRDRVRADRRHVAGAAAELPLVRGRARAEREQMIDELTGWAIEAEADFQIARVYERWDADAHVERLRRQTPRRAHRDLYRALLERQQQALERMRPLTPRVFLCVRLADPRTDLPAKARELLNHTPSELLQKARAALRLPSCPARGGDPVRADKRNRQLPAGDPRTVLSGESQTPNRPADKAQAAAGTRRPCTRCTRLDQRDRSSSERR